MKTILLIFLALILVGCGGNPLYSDLTEQEANEMAALLQNAGITATKSSGKEANFAVSTSSADFARAIELLSANGYPRNRFESLGEVFEKEGFVSSPLEERARLNYAQSQEMTKTLESIDGVIMARVHLAVPETDPLSDEVKPASASIFIKHRRGVDLSGYEGQIKALVVNGIESLPYENVTVAMFPAEPLPVQKQVAKEQTFFTASMAAGNPFVMAALMMLMLVALALFGWLYLWRKKSTENLPAVQRNGMES